MMLLLALATLCGIAGLSGLAALLIADHDRGWIGISTLVLLAAAIFLGHAGMAGGSP